MSIAPVSTTSQALGRRLAGDSPALGGWVTLGDPVGSEIIARAGYDWIGVDAQHGTAGPAIVAHLQALAVTGTPALVRVAANTSQSIGAALDAGASGVIVPMVESADEARAAVAACRYAPAGRRSWGTTRASLGVTGLTPQAARDAALCFVMAETRRAVDAIDAIAAVDGLSGVFVGPSDLAISIGCAPAKQTGAVAELIERVGAACLDRGIIAGIYAGAPESAVRWASGGFRLIALHNDAQLLLAAARSQLHCARRDA